VGLRCKSKACSATAWKGSGDNFKESDDGGKVNGSGGMTTGGDIVLTTTEVVAPINVQFPFKNIVETYPGWGPGLLVSSALDLRYRVEQEH